MRQANEFVTSLDGGIDDSVDTFDLADAIPSSPYDLTGGDFTLRIGSAADGDPHEYAYVPLGGVSGVALSGVTRGAEGTTPLAWSSGDRVAQVYTVAALPPAPEFFVQSSAPDANPGNVWVNDDDSSDPQVKIRGGDTAAWDALFHYIGREFLANAQGLVGGGLEGYQGIFDMGPGSLGITFVNPDFASSAMTWSVDVATGAVVFTAATTPGGSFISHVFGTFDPSAGAGYAAPGGSLFFMNDGAGTFGVFQKTDDADDTAWALLGSGGGAVDSVNGQTGTVVLDASDVGAPAGSGTSSGTNTGDQTIPVGGIPAVVLAASAAAGSSPNFLRRDDTIAAFDATNPSTQASADSPVVGTAAVAARRDHKHGMPTIPAAAAGGTPATAIGTAGAAGSAGTFLRTDDTLGILDGTAPTTSAVGDAAATGSVAKAARRDHVHGREAFGASAAAVGTSAAGAASTPSRSDHVHATGAGTPSTQAIGDSAATGTGPAAAMTDHKHAITNPLTTQDDLWVGGASGAPARLAKGSDSQVLTVDPVTHHLIWATPSGSTAQPHNELNAAVLVNATSTGDAGSRADHFAGTSLDARWVAEAASAGSGPTVKNSAMGVVMGAATHHRLQAYTPSGAFRVEARMATTTGSGDGFGLFVRDSGTGDSSGNGMLAHLDTNGLIKAYSFDSGSFTIRGTSYAFPGWAPGYYAAVERDGSNNWKIEFSLDRAQWITPLSGYSKTFTVAKVGFRFGGGGNGLFATTDFFDVVS